MTSMLMSRTQFQSVAAGGRRAAKRASAGHLTGVVKGGAVQLCPSSLPVYLPGGELMQEQGANSTINLWNSDRRVNLV